MKLRDRKARLCRGLWALEEDGRHWRVLHR